MKKQLLFFVAMLSAALGLSAAQYTLVTSASEINTEDTYVIATLYNGNIYAVNATQGAVQVMSGSTLPTTLTINDETVRQFKVVANGDYKALYCISVEKYVSAGSSTTISDIASLKGTSDQLTFADVNGKAGCVTITSAATATRSFAFSSGTTFKNYATSNLGTGNYTYASLYRLNNDSREAVTLTFDNAPTSLNVGETASISCTSTPTVSGIAYASSNPEVATIDATGLITGIAAGTTTITANYAGDETHQPASVNFELNVVKPLAANEFQIVFTSGTNSGTALKITDALSSFIESGTEVVSAIKDTSTAYANSSNGIRFASGNNPGTLTLTLAKEYQKVVTGMTINAAAYNTTDGTLTVNDVTNTISGTGLQDYEYTFSPNEVTGEIAINVPKSKRVYVKAITVRFREGDPADYVATPTFSPAAGEVESGTEVTISCDTPDAVIYYTLDETEPTTSSTVFNTETPIVISAATTIKTIAVKEGMENSSVATAAYTVKPEFGSLAEWLAAQPAANARINAPLTAIYQSSKYLYVTEGDAFTMIYGDLGKTYANGDVIPAGVEGKYDGTYYEMLPVVATLGDATPGTPVAPETITAEGLVAEKVNHYVKLENVNITAVDGNNITANVNGTDVTIYNRFGLTGVTAAENLTITGFISIYKDGTVQLYPTEIVAGVGTKVAKPVVTPAPGTIYPGDVITISCDTDGASLHGYMDKVIDGTTVSTTTIENVATYAYTVTTDDVNATFSIEVMASKEGFENSSELSCEFTVTERPAATETTAMFEWTKPEKYLEDFDENSTNINVNYRTFNEGIVSAAITGNGTVGACFYNKNTWALRLYKKKDETNTGHVLTISLPEEQTYHIAKVEFTYSNTTKLTLAEGQPGAFDGTTWTPTPIESRAVVEPKQLVFTSATDNVQIESTTVTYTDLPTGISTVETNADVAPVYYNLQGVRVAHPAQGMIYIRVRGSQVDKIRF